MSQGKFFAIGAKEFAAACDLGMNPAVAFLIMARGTGRDNATTSWSALSIFNHSGMARRRAQTAIETLTGAGLVEVLQAGRKPRYKLHRPPEDGDLLWLPNELVDGAGKEVPPITKLREAGRLDLLQKLVGLYGLHDLDNDGGLPRNIAWTTWDRQKICDVGMFALYGFENERQFATSNGFFQDVVQHEDEEGNKGAWAILMPLIRMGLISRALYMAESKDHEAELIYPVNAHGTDEALSDLLCWLEESNGKGFAAEADFYEQLGIAPKMITKATLVGVYRLHYRPKTGKTSRWLAIDMGRAEALVGIIGQICGHSSQPDVHIKDVQGF